MRRWMASITSSSRSSDLDQLAVPAAGAGEAAQEAGVDGLVDAEREHAHAAARSPSSRRIWSSLPTWPSVTRTRMRSALAVPATASERAGLPQRLRPSRCRRGRSILARNSTARKRLRSVGRHQARRRQAGGVSMRSSKARTVKRSRSVSVSTMRAAARRAATIFQPAMLPERSSTNTTSRGRRGACAVAGGTRVSRKVPSSPVGVGRQRQRVGSQSRCADAEAQDEVAVEPLARLQRCAARRASRRLDARAGWSGNRASGSPAGSMSTSSDRRTGLGKPGSSTGGVMREASGTASVSAAYAVADAGAPAAAPGNVARRHHQREAEGRLAVAIGQRADERQRDAGAVSPGSRLPTRMVKTPGRSSSAIAARWPAAMAWS